jgi:UDP-2,3-diacylglucosamine hydrolase
MPHTLFISDLHLSPEHPRTTQAFLDFLADRAPAGEALYILGDLFEYWAGDDDLSDPHHARVAQALAALAGTTAVFLMRGNRDLLLGEGFARAASARLLPDPVLIDLYGTPTLLTHGDALCIDDAAYLAFRAKVTDPRWQAEFLSQPLALRKAQIERLRRESEQEKQAKSEALMDVNSEAVAALLREYDYPRLIHGHTHRPARHLHRLDGHVCERWVLDSWYDEGGFLHCERSGCDRRPLP